MDGSTGAGGDARTGRLLRTFDAPRPAAESSTVDRLNGQVIARYPDVHVYCPGEDAVAVLHFAPEIVSCVGVLGLCFWGIRRLR